MCEHEWKEIETAPRDGTHFLSCNMRQGKLQTVAWYNRLHKRWTAQGGNPFHQFTHWMPLPQPPDEKVCAEANQQLEQAVIRAAIAANPDLQGHWLRKDSYEVRELVAAVNALITERGANNHE